MPGFQTTLLAEVQTVRRATMVTLCSRVTISTVTTNGGHSNDGVIFKIKPDGSSFHLLHKFGETHHDGKNPYGSLLLTDDKLYGTSANGGDNDLGTVFVINADGNNYQRLYSFSGQTNNWDGSKPIDNVILVN